MEKVIRRYVLVREKVSLDSPRAILKPTLAVSDCPEPGKEQSGHRGERC